MNFRTPITVSEMITLRTAWRLCCQDNQLCVESVAKTTNALMHDTVVRSSLNYMSSWYKQKGSTHNFHTIYVRMWDGQGMDLKILNLSTCESGFQKPGYLRSETRLHTYFDDRCRQSCL